MAKVVTRLMPGNHSCLEMKEATFPRKIYFPTQNLLSDAEVTICKYKWLTISANAFVLGCLK